MRIKYTRAEEIALEYFDLINVSWQDFEDTKTGDITICGVRFSLRVGRFLKRPTQAIIAINKFVRTRAAPKKFECYALHDLDPRFPDKCWYNHTFVRGAGEEGCWHPGGSYKHDSKVEIIPPHDTIIFDNAHIFNSLEGWKKRRRR